MDATFEPPAADRPAGAPRQRARGEIRLAFARAGGRTEAANLYETGGLRARFPRSGPECEAVIVNTGGGMAGGDRTKINLALGANARALATTQSQEKIYRADGDPTEVDTRIEVAPGAALVWAPQETLLFQGARFRRRLEADVAEGGSLLLVEAIVFGRLAHGETRIDAALRDDWRLRRAGRLVFAEALRIENAGATLDRLAVGAGARALATLVLIDAAAPSRLEPLRAAMDEIVAEPGERLEAGASVVDGVLIARAASPSPQRLRALLIATMRALRGKDAPRVWS